MPRAMTGNTGSPYMRLVQLEGGQRIYAHLKEDCQTKYCPVHNPSNHHMREWPQNFRHDIYRMERLCPHGVGHPDPDDINTDTVHGCDGCCLSKVPEPDRKSAIEHTKKKRDK